MTTDQAQAAPAAALPPRGTVAAYEYDAAYPTPHKRTQLVLVTGYTDPDEAGVRRVLAIPLAHTDELASFTVDQLAPAP